MIDFHVSGLDELVLALSELQGKKLQATTRDVLKDLSKKVVVPMMKAELPQGDHSPWTRPTEQHPNIGKKGGPMARKVTARTIRRRRGEIVAISVASRTWYDHFVARGTKAHLVSAWTGAAMSGGRAGSDAVRRRNRGTASLRDALMFAGVYRFQVYHPGARSNDYVTRTASRVRTGGQLPDALAAALIRKFDDAKRSP